MPATEPGSGAQRSWFVPRCAASRWLACWLLALAGCLNPVPDTDPSVQDSVGVIDVPPTETPGSTDVAPGNGTLPGDAFWSDEPASPVVNPPEMSGSGPDAGAPPPAADAGADAHPEDEQGEDEQ